jgi:tryptophan-rich sensory protein
MEKETIILIIYSILLFIPVCRQYDFVTKHPAQPPGGFFGLIWTTIYLCLIYSLNLYMNKNKNYQIGLGIALLLLFLDKFWQQKWCNKQLSTSFLIIFFYALFALILLLIYYNSVPLAGILISPLFVWLIIAAMLNFHYANTIDNKEKF